MVLGMMLPLATVAYDRSTEGNQIAQASNTVNSTGTADAGATGDRGNSASNNSAAVAPAAAAGEAQATFKNFVRGDHLYAEFDLPVGREPDETAMLKDFEIAAFLNAHKGKPLFVVIETKKEFLDPPGEKMDVTSLVSARSATQTSKQWLQSLTPQQRRAALSEIERLPPESG
jgi:hypothetical protein